MDTIWLRQRLLSGLVIPAHPLALNPSRRLDERRQRALTRYYLATGAGGVAIGVHTTQFAIREERIGLFRPVLEIAREEVKQNENTNIITIGGICGSTNQAIQEATLLHSLGYHAGLVSLGALQQVSEAELIQHCSLLAQILPIVGFYLQPAVGGRRLSYGFWRRFAEIENVVAIKIAPFNRYQTIDVVRAVAESGREDIALYTGNDDNILADLATPYRFQVGHDARTLRIVGGLLGHWAVWTKRAVEQLAFCKQPVQQDTYVNELLQRNIEVTDCNAAFFDAANHFAGCIPGIHEVLKRQGLLEGIECLDPNETLSYGQSDEISRVYHAYPHLNDDTFVAEHLDEWLR